MQTPISLPTDAVTIPLHLNSSFHQWSREVKVVHRFDHRKPPWTPPSSRPLDESAHRKQGLEPRAQGKVIDVLRNTKIRRTHRLEGRLSDLVHQHFGNRLAVRLGGRPNR